MIDPESYVYERVFEKITSTYKDIAITDEEIYTPPKLPSVSLIMFDNTIATETNDSSNKEKYSSATFEASVYTDGKNKKRRGKEIFDALDKEMKAIGFIRTSYNVLNQDYSSIQRIVARYTAICGENNTFYWR
ncbi:MAG: hypothetical protein J6L85_08835 [Clostridia bacterium]|nr:hypothetical protein [Clostridia bacterium]